MTDLITALSKSEIIPDIIPTSQAQSNPPGEKIDRDTTLEEPDIKVTPLSDTVGGEGKTYTLVMTDPDAPSRADPKFGEWRHWVITGITFPTSKGKEGVIVHKPKASSTPYHPPGPPPGTGLHRYAFLLFEEPSGSITIHPDAAEYQAAFEKRRKWNAMNFAQHHGLKLVGATFFLTKANE
ncbi:phosphatidylethanolamine-binding protein [Cyathus striatus]|nr:phosphatidylethanolamine-binding protein [Cyathus striatus]